MEVELKHHHTCSTATSKVQPMTSRSKWPILDGPSRGSGRLVGWDTYILLQAKLCQIEILFLRPLTKTAVVYCRTKLCCCSDWSGMWSLLLALSKTSIVATRQSTSCYHHTSLDSGLYCSPNKLVQGTASFRSRESWAVPLGSFSAEIVSSASISTRTDWSD